MEYQCSDVTRHDVNVVWIEIASPNFTEIYGEKFNPNFWAWPNLVSIENGIDEE